MKTSKVAAVCAMAIGAAILSSAASAADTPTTIRVVPNSDIVSYDPHGTTLTALRDFGYLVYDTLFAQDANFRPQPQMADSFTVSPDGLAYTIKVREGLKWTDGADVTAEDVVASLSRWMPVSLTGQFIQGALDKMVVADKLTFTIHLKEPLGAIIPILAGSTTPVPFILPKKHAEIPMGKPFPEVIGSGPFRFSKDEYRAGAKAVFPKNAAYVPRKEPRSGLAGAKIPQVDRIEWTIVTDGQTAANALLAGEVDFIVLPAAELIPLLKSAPGVVVARNPGADLQLFIRFNHLTRPFDDLRVRQAVALAVRQSDFLSGVASLPEDISTCSSVYGCIAPHSGPREPVDPRWGQGNIAGAKELLAKSSYKGEKAVLLVFTGGMAVSPNSIALLSQVMRQIGMNVDVQSAAGAAYRQRRASMEPLERGGWSAFVTTASMTDVSTPLVNTMIAANCKDAWLGWPCNPQIQAKIKEYTRAGDERMRDVLAKEIDQMSREYVTYLPLGSFANPVVYRDVLKNVPDFPVSVFWGVEKAAK